MPCLLEKVTRFLGGALAAEDGPVRLHVTVEGMCVPAESGQREVLAEMRHAGRGQRLVGTPDAELEPHSIRSRRFDPVQRHPAALDPDGIGVPGSHRVAQINR
jgi:hypothetical protein